MSSCLDTDPARQTATEVDRQGLQRSCRALARYPLWATLAGLLWEKRLEEKLMSIGWKKMSSRGCMYYPKQDQLLPNAYVGDLKMVGRTERPNQRGRS